MSTITKIKDMLSARKEVVNVLWYAALRDAAILLYGYALDFDDDMHYVPQDKSLVLVPDAAEPKELSAYVDTYLL